MNRKLVGAAVLCLVPVIFQACGSTDRQTCEPGRQIDCTCSGGATGFQKCLDDGSGWGECECGCEKDCTGLACGPDPVCGESCGTCDTGEDCVSGACRCGGTGPDCGAGETCCGSECSDLDVDRDHCGDCSVACNPGEFCRDGTCVPGCNDSGDCVGLTCCDGSCVDLGVNNSHCGACGVACGDGEICVGGSCQCGGTGPDCSSDEICCGTTCHDPETDEDHCGDCTTSCDLGYICCDSECFDYMNSDLHCGDCETSCESWEGCLGGICVPDMPCDCVYDCGQRESGLTCNQTENYCEPGSPPVSCQENCDCYIAEVCRNGQCVEMASECSADGDCDSGQVCSGGWCVNVPCQSREDCSPPECVCVNQVCTSPPSTCQSNQDCCWGYVCSFGSCRRDVVNCLSDENCIAVDPEYPRCLDGMCVLECVNDLDCPLPGQVCIDNHCVEPGCTVASCQQGQWCDVTDGQCKPGCDENSDCVSPDTCNFSTHQCGQTDCCGGACDLLTQYCEGFTCQCVDLCQTDEDCPAGFVCKADGRCWCTTTSCPSGSTCNVQTGSCEVDPILCAEDNDCPDGWTCDQVASECESLGTAQEGNVCYGDSHCDAAAGLLCDSSLFCIGCAISDPEFNPTYTCRYECSLLLPNCPGGQECLYRHLGLKGLCMPP